MSFVLLGILNSQASGAAQAYFLSVLGGASGDTGKSVAIDSSDNIYAFGFTESSGAGSIDFLLAKYDTSGSVEWQRTLGSANGEFGNGNAVDSAGNIYVTGSTDGAGAGGNDFLLAKYDSSGTIQWQRVLGGAGAETANSVAVDSSDNVYVTGFTTSQGIGNSAFLLAKYNSAGTIQWQRILGGSTNNIATSVGVDSLDNVYVTGRQDSTGAGGYDLLLAKYNSAGTIQWQRTLGGAANEFGDGISVDSSDNIYVIGLTASTGAGGNDLLLAKYNSSGTIQWQRVLGGSGADRGFSLAFDSSSNVYLKGTTSSTGAGGNDFLLAKYDSSGTIQWQRVLGGTGGEAGSSIRIDSADDLYAFGNTNSTGAGGTDFLLAKLPNDGSLEGTYSLDGNNIIYQPSTLTGATSTLTDASASLTASTSTLTAATASLTSASASLTVVTEEI